MQEGWRCPGLLGTSGDGGSGEAGCGGGCSEVRRPPGEALGEAGRVLVLERAWLAQS